MSGWIVANLPPHQIYCEPYAGAASVLMSKPRVPLEIYNDLDENIVNLFRVLRSPAMAKDLENVLRLTPFARKEFEATYSCPIAAIEDPIERARRLLIRCYMGLGSDSGSRPCKTGFRAANRGPRLPPPRDWVNYADAIPGFVERLMGVLVECKPALDVIRARIRRAPCTISTRRTSRPRGPVTATANGPTPTK